MTGSSARGGGFIALFKRFAAPLARASNADLQRFALKFSVAALILGLAAVYVSNHWRILWDRQTVKCMDANVLLFHRDRTGPFEVGDIVVFASRGAAPVFPDGTRLAKIIAAREGDVVEVRAADEAILVNGREIARGLPALAGAAEADRARFFGRRVLAPGEFWMTGTTQHSFDSRYWGVLHENQIEGRAWVLF